MWDSKPAIYNSKGTHNSVSQGRWMSFWGTKIPILSYWTELVTGRGFSGSQDISTISSSHYSNRKAAGYCSMVRFKEECPPHRIDCPLGRKPGGSTRAEEKPLRDTACWLRGKRLDMPCDSYWGWLSWFSRILSHFVSFKNRNHWPQFESYLKSSSDRGAIYIKLDSAWRKYTRNHHSRVIT